MARQLPASIAHYTIISAIGAGGMGEVYLAQDTKLERQVALKVLLDEVAGDEERVRRFVQEAKAASALNHPNILTVYEIGEFEHTRYIATELIKGETLRDRLRGEPMTLREVLDVAMQVAAALNAAHSAGIVHRDIKPENIMLRDDGIVKVLDFGLAKLSEPPASAVGREGGSEDATRAQVNTRPGVVMGTVAYMSPEQARAKETDARSDVWSLGIVIYEMLAGATPFAGETANDSIAAILTKEPPPLADDTPSELRRIIRKSLQKQTDERYQTVKDLLLDVKNLKRELEFSEELERSNVPQSTDSSNVGTAQFSEHATAAFGVPSSDGDLTAATEPPRGGTQNLSSLEYAVSQAKGHKLAIAVAAILLLAVVSAVGYFGFFSKRSSGQINSIAVMPFENRNSDADTDYLSDGLAESVIFRLTQIPDLRVSPTSSVMRYKGKETDIAKIASELGVDAVMTGRLTKRGDNLNITVELVDARTNKSLWGEQYERKLSELLTTQREIVAEIVGKLQLKLSGESEQKLAKKYTDNNEAYQLYLKGRFYGSKRTSKDAQKAIESYQQAIAIDPKFALAYAGLAEANWFLALYSYPQVNEVIPRARELALKAIELDDSLAEPHSVLGAICLNSEHDFACAEREQKRAIELNPNFWEGHRRLGNILMKLGRFEEARVAIRRALEIDPLAPVTNHQYAWLLFVEKKYDESETLSKKNIDLDPNFWYAHWQLFLVYRQKRDFPLAVEYLAKVQESRGEPDAAKFIRESFTDGDWQGFLKKITADRTRLKLYPFFVATFLTELGEKDKAFAALDEAIDTNDQAVSEMKIDLFIDPLRDDPRFKEVIKKVGFPE